MKRLLISLISSLVLLSGCSKGDPIKNQERADYVASNGAIAQVMSGTSSQVLFSGENEENTVYKPYNPPKDSTEARIPASSLLLAIWFAFDEENKDKATIEWSFDKSDYVTLKLPELPSLPHATVTFNSFPEDDSVIKLVLTGSVTYNKATSSVTYNISLKNSRPNK